MMIRIPHYHRIQEHNDNDITLMQAPLTTGFVCILYPVINKTVSYKKGVRFQDDITESMVLTMESWSLDMF